MLAGALGTYVAALVVIAAATAAGAGILALAGRREPSWTAPSIGLAAITVVAWWAVRLPGHGRTALIAVVLLAVIGAGAAARRLDGVGGGLVRGLPAAALALFLASIPFIVEAHFGVLGTGFNVDMSQHLFAASWIADPSGPAPGLFSQGYPLGPHALAVATGEVSGEPAMAFSGVTIALPVIAALTALAALRGWPGWRAAVAAALAAFAYLAASLLAQGSFKELFEITFLLGFALCLRDLGAGQRAPRSLLAALPLAVLGAGALYAYSAPGLVWPAAALIAWGAFELAGSPGRVATRLRGAMPAALLAALVLLVLAAPEIDRIVNFGGSVGTVSGRDAAASPAGDLLAARGDRGGGGGGEPRFNDDLGNLFGGIDPLEALGVWPSGDFRVAPGDGAMPAAAFYLGALLGVIALAFGVRAALRRGETALLGALAAAAAIWLAARLLSTPYTTAKALAVLAPLAMLVAAVWALAPAPERPTFDGHRGRAERLAALAFAVAAALSSGLALANAPVGPREYSPGVTALSPIFAGSPTLLLAPARVLADEHGSDFYGWELREAKPACVARVPAAPPAGPAPGGIRFVLTIDATAAPFEDLARRATVAGVTLWEAGSRSGAAISRPVPGSTDCGITGG